MVLSLRGLLMVSKVFLPMMRFLAFLVLWTKYLVSSLLVHFREEPPPSAEILPFAERAAIRIVFIYDSVLNTNFSLLNILDASSTSTPVAAKLISNVIPIFIMGNSGE